MLGFLLNDEAVSSRVKTFAFDNTLTFVNQMLAPTKTPAVLLESCR